MTAKLDPRHDIGRVAGCSSRESDRDLLAIEPLTTICYSGWATPEFVLSIKSFLKKHVWHYCSSPYQLAVMCQLNKSFERVVIRARADSAASPHLHDLAGSKILRAGETLLHEPTGSRVEACCQVQPLK